MDELDYKSLQESLTSNNNGSTPLETTAVILPSIIGVNLVTMMRSFHRGYNGPTVFFVEFLCMIMPCILSFTVFSDHLVSILTSLVISCWFTLYVKLCMIKKKVWFSFSENFGWKAIKIVMNSKLPSKQRPYITNFRAITNMLTVLCILAVDFNIFPRRYAKTETFGYGVMDLGVGLFIVANALVAPEARGTNFVATPLMKTLIHCIPLIILGVGRIIATRQVEYQEHVTEYGQHWNFFFTLIVTKILCSIILKHVNHNTSTFILLSGLIIVFYEIVLHGGARDWIFSDAPRLGFISANREGLSSTVGYISLYFGGVAFGRAFYKWDKLTGASNVSLIKRFSSLACILWFLTLLCEKTIGVSRRLANMGYLFWIFSFTATVMVLLLIVELSALYLKNISPPKDQADIIFVPDISDAINRNGLLYFLLGNLLTGIINLSMKTFLLGAVPSIAVITLYMLVISATVSVLYHNNIFLKL